MSLESLSKWLPWNRDTEAEKRHKETVNLLKKIMATLEERLAAIESALDEAGTEINAELAKLREQIANGTVTPAALETITRLEAKGKALADIIPNA